MHKKKKHVYVMDDNEVDQDDTNVACKANRFMERSMIVQ